MIVAALLYCGALMDLDTLLEDWTVHEPGDWDNTEGPPGWYAVSNPTGIVAYFAHQGDAYYYRMAKINLLLNITGGH